MKVLITGISGFAGIHLTDWCLRQGCDVSGLDRGTQSSGLDAFSGRVQLYKCELLEYDAVENVLRQTQPDRIFHLAGRSNLGSSWSVPRETLSVNILGQANLFEALRALGLSPKVLVAGSSEEYGVVTDSDLPIRESQRLLPTSPYAVSKAAQDMMGYQYFKNYGLEVVVTRAFNQTGPGRSADFVTGDFARQVARIASGKQEPVIWTGNLNVVRDFTDIRDAVRAYWLALEYGQPGGVYNIASGRGVKIGDILELLKKISGIWFDVALDPKRFRPTDLPVMIGDSTKFFKQTGWSPEISFEQSMRDLYEDWQIRIHKEANSLTEEHRL